MLERAFPAPAIPEGDATGAGQSLTERSAGAGATVADACPRWSRNSHLNCCLIFFSCILRNDARVGTACLPDPSTAFGACFVVSGSSLPEKFPWQSHHTVICGDPCRTLVAHTHHEDGEEKVQKHQPPYNDNEDHEQFAGNSRRPSGVVHDVVPVRCRNDLQMGPVNARGTSHHACDHTTHLKHT